MHIDAHHHFWNPARGDYGWMPEDNATLCRQYGPVDLAPHLAEAGITATILVQAATSIEESEYLLGLADATPHVAGASRPTETACKASEIQGRPPHDPGYSG